MIATVCSCTPAGSWVWPAVFVAATLGGGLLAAITSTGRHGAADPEEVRRLRRQLAVEVAQRRRTVAVAREWLPASELAHALLVDPAEIGGGRR